MRWASLQKNFSVIVSMTVVSTCIAAADLSGLVRNSPFGSTVREKSVSNQEVPLELRGIVVEGGKTYFTLYDGTSKKWTTVLEGEEADSISVKEYNRAKDAVVLNFMGKTVTLALHSSSSNSHRDRVVTSVAQEDRVRAPSITRSTDAPLVAMTASIEPEPAEARRLELLASALRQQIEHAKRQTEPSRS